MDNLYPIKFLGYTDSATLGAELGPEPDVKPRWLCPSFENMRLRDGKVKQRLGQTPVGLGPYTDPQMLFWVKLLDAEYLLVVANGQVLDDITGALTGGANRFTPGLECNAAWINGIVVIGNGVDPNVRFDGATVARLTAPPCNASGMILTAGSAGSPNGTFQYAVKFVNADGVEGDIIGLGFGPGGLSPVITVADQQIGLTNLPVCPTDYLTGAGSATTDCPQINLYRTKDGGVVKGVGSAFFFVATLSGGTTTYTDNLADSDLGLEMLNLSSPNSPFPPCRYFQEHMGRLFGAGCQTADSNRYTLHVSDNLDPTTARLANDDPTAPLNAYQGGRYSLASRSGGEITAISESFGATVMVFTGGELFIWTGTDLTNFQLYPLAMHGCVSHRSIGHFENYVLWLAADGIYTYLGSQYSTYLNQNFTRVIEGIRNTIEAMSAADMAAASAVVSDGRYYLFWPHGSLVCDLIYDRAFYTDGPNRFGQATESLYTATFRNRIYAINTSTNGAWQLETGSTDNGQPIPCHLQSAPLMLAGPQQQARVIRWGGTFRACSESVSGALIRGSSQTIQSIVVPLVSGSASIVPFPVSQYPLAVARVRQKAGPTAISDWFALDFTCDSTSGEFEVIEGVFEWEPGGGVNG